MKKILISLTAMFVVCLVTYADGVKDVTNLYLQNPSFELDDVTKLSVVNNTADGLRGYTCAQPSGWSVSGTSVTQLIVNKDCYSDNNFGKITTIADGNQAYYLRQGWATGTTTISQSVTLPAGKYRFSVQTRSGYANGAVSSMTLSVGSENSSMSFTQGSAGCFTTMKWTENSVDFSLSASAKITFSAAITWQSGGSCIMLDDCKLLDITDYKEPEQPTEEDITSPTEGVINQNFVSEAEMMTDLLQMLARFSEYMVNDFQECAAPNSKSELCGCFRGESTMASNEAGVRTNADLSMVSAFLVKYGKPAGVSLPNGVTWSKLEDIARKSLVFAYSTHKANKLKVCSGNDYWGSTSGSDHVWESSLWAMSVAYSAFFQWDKLNDTQKDYIYKLLKAECNYELNRTIPTGYAGDTKAEENGWEADVLAVTLGLFPNDPLAPQWFDRMRDFAVNSYSHFSDTQKTTPLDDYDAKSAADYYKGNNLYNDYSLQNHNLFHTSYQNVVMQELGEAALALKMFQQGIHGTEKWKSNALKHNNAEVMENILNWLALADGELAMPNGNDWSLFLYDQITSYSTQACFEKDPHALMLENLAYKQIKARQQTTSDGSWLLRPDVQARRMGVEAHRVMMTYLMHMIASTAELEPTTWSDFRKQYSEAKIIPCQNIVRANTESRFSCFSWSTGLQSYTGYFTPNCADKNKIIVPYRANNTGNLTGWYEVSGIATNATPVISGIYNLDGDAYCMNGELNTNNNSLNKRFAIYSTPGNALIYLDFVKANSTVTITSDKTGLLAISTDELTKPKRTLYYDKDGEITHTQTDGSSMFSATADWVNIDNSLGVVGLGGKKIAFGERGANNSIFTSKLYPTYESGTRSVSSGSEVDRHNIIYYSSNNAESTKLMAEKTVLLKNIVPSGWNGVIAPDPDGAYYILISNFNGNKTANISNISIGDVAPIFTEPTTINNSKASVSLKLEQNNSYAYPSLIYVKGSNISAQLLNSTTAYITALEKTDITVSDYVGNSQPILLDKNETIEVTIKDGDLYIETKDFPVQAITDFTGYIVNPSFQGNTKYGWTDANNNVVINFNEAERWDQNFNIYQKITGLPEGTYTLTCQGFYRAGDYGVAENSRKSSKETINTVLYATSSAENISQPLYSIFEEADKMGVLGVKTSYGYIPDNMEQASQYFHQKLYPNALEVKVGADGELTIGVKKTTTISHDWSIFSNFTLTRKDDETAINRVKSNTIERSSAIYRLNGSKVTNSSELSCGIYIIDGKKVFIR